MRSPDNFLKNSCTALFLLIFICCPLQAQAKLVIAQGGASGHLMEHNLPSVTLAVAMDADIIKMDLVLTRDNEVIVFGSPTLDRATDVAEIFPTRAREDGKFYALDFSLDEIRLLTLRDPAGRFPADLHPRLTIPTFKEELSLIRSLERSLNKNISIAVEITRPWFHHKEERDISVPVLTILQKYGYGMESDNTLLLSYDAVELQRIAKTLLPERQMSIKLVQLIESNDGKETMTKEWDEWVSYNYDWMFSNTGIRSLAASVDAIGLPKNMLVDSQGQLKLGNFIKNAHQLDTLIFTFPIQKNDPTRPPFLLSFEEELDFFFFTVGVDGIMTDSCGEAVSYLRNKIETLQQPPQEPSLQQPLQEPLQLQEREEPAVPQAAPLGNDPLQLTIPPGYEKKE